MRAEQPLEFMPEGVDFLAARNKMAVVAPLILAGVAPARVLRGGAAAERTIQVCILVCVFASVLAQYSHHMWMPGKCLMWHSGRDECYRVFVVLQMFSVHVPLLTLSASSLSLLSTCLPHVSLLFRPF